jgi:predicted RNase H-like HicB family nuclease
MYFHIETTQAKNGRWIAEIPVLAGAKAYGKTCDEAVRKVQALALHVLADRLERGENVPEIEAIFSMTV